MGQTKLKIIISKVLTRQRKNERLNFSDTQWKLKKIIMHLDLQTDQFN